MRILHVALDVNPSQGGPPRSIAGICRSLAEIGADVTLFVHDPTGSETANLGQCRLFTGSGRGMSGNWRADIRRVLDEVKPDIVHQHALWCLPLHVDDVEFRRRKIPYVIAPRGLLDAWSVQQKWLKKKVAMLAYQGKDLRCARAIHVTAEMEAEHCRRLGFDHKFIYSPNGVNLPAEIPPLTRMSDGRKRMLFLSRIHPKKGLLELVRAWAEVPHDGWCLEVVGNDSEGYWPTVQAEIDRLCTDGSVVRTPFQDDHEKWKTYCAADCFVLPTHTENFGIVIAEALYAGLPVITTKNAPWNGLVDNKCGWWIDLTHETLKRSLVDAMSLSDTERAEMGSLGRAFVEREFNWTNIARNLLKNYQSLLS